MSFDYGIMIRLHIGLRYRCSFRLKSTYFFVQLLATSLLIEFNVLLVDVNTKTELNYRQNRDRLDTCLIMMLIEKHTIKHLQSFYS